MEESALEGLKERLDVLTGLILCKLLKDDAIEPRDVALALRRTGVSPARIANLLDITANAVRVAAYQARKKSTSKRKVEAR